MSAPSRLAGGHLKLRDIHGIAVVGDMSDEPDGGSESQLADADASTPFLP